MDKPDYNQVQQDNVWFTADPHFGHTKIIEYCRRPFSTVREMNRTMIRYWNDRVSPEDTVYCSGDFTMGADAQQYFRHLNGYIRIIPGGHDKKWRKKKGPWYSAGGHRVAVLSEVYTVYALYGAGLLDLRRIVLSHCPLENWEGKRYGVWHLHGHSHGRSRSVPGRIDVGVDCHKFFPISLTEVGELMRKQETGGEDARSR